MPDPARKYGHSRLLTFGDLEIDGGVQSSHLYRVRPASGLNPVFFVSRCPVTADSDRQSSDANPLTHP